MNPCNFHNEIPKITTIIIKLNKNLRTKAKRKQKRKKQVVMTPNVNPGILET
jgi:hypothetical protein